MISSSVCYNNTLKRKQQKWFRIGGGGRFLYVCKNAGLVAYITAELLLHMKVLHSKCEVEVIPKITYFK